MWAPHESSSGPIASHSKSWALAGELRVRQNTMLLGRSLTHDSHQTNVLAGERALEAASQARSGAEAVGDLDAIKLLNVVQFALLFNLDLSVLLEDLNTTSPTWRKRLHARHLILLLFECVDDFVSLLGKEFRSVLLSREHGTELLARLNALHAQLRTFQQRYGHFRDIRTTLVAHRDHHAPRLLETLEQIRASEVDAAALEMLNWLTALHILCTDAINVTSPESV
jgi:hypothetical protein